MRIHPIDRAATVLLRRLPPAQRVFRNGWGDAERIAEYRTYPRRIGPAADIEITWGAPRTDGALRSWDGTFPSPAPHLPPEARIAHVRRISPVAGAGRTCLLMASWNDHDYRTRTQIAGHLATRGIASVMLENPYYGRRRVGGTHEQPIATVADFGIMGRAAIEEGRAILGALAAGPGGSVGVSGYSMGGNIAAMVGALSPVPVAIAPLAASHSPGPVFAGGVLRGAVDWEALAGAPDPVAALGETLGHATVLDLPVPAHTAAAVMVAARHDGFVPPATAMALHDHWPGSELRWVGAGHASMLWFFKRTLARGIADAFDRFERAN